MLETIRAYALERLAESGEMETLRERHAGYFGDLIIKRIGIQIYLSEALYWLNWLARELDNIRAALAWSLSTARGIEFGTELVFSMFWFWYRRGYFMEGYMWAERILAVPEMQTISKHRGLALLTSGMMALWKGEQDTALKHLHESLEIMQRLEDGQWMAHGMMSKAVALINMGRDSAARPLLEQAQAMFKEQNQTPFIAVTLIHLGNVELGLGHPEQARALHEEALGIARSIGEPWLLSFALNNLGEVARTQGQYDQARTYYEECEALLRNTGDQGDMARFVHSQGYIAQHEEEFELAESQFRKSLKMFRRLGNRRGIAEGLAGLAGLKARQGEAEWGTTMLSAAESVLQSTGGAWWPADRVEVERNREIIQTALAPDEFTKAWKKGGGMTIDQAIAFASNEA
jgi:tetratricopeptide (TPR) repeat protein